MSGIATCSFCTISQNYGIRKTATIDAFSASLQFSKCVYFMPRYEKWTQNQQTPVSSVQHLCSP